MAASRIVAGKELLLALLLGDLLGSLLLLLRHGDGS
jgi:hypothetical protein